MKSNYLLPLSLSLLLLPSSIPQAQSATKSHGEKAASVPSTSLILTGLSGTEKTLSPTEFRLLSHVTVRVHNAHTNREEIYSGVPVQALLAHLAGTQEEGHTASVNTQVVVAGATDSFNVVITMCDVNPDCRSGQAIVADAMDSADLGKDGAFKLVLTEDKKPARWARNLNSLTVKVVETK